MSDYPFKSKSKALLVAYNKHKDSLVSCEIVPISADICSSCWYKVECLRNILLHQAKNSCCLYEKLQNIIHVNNKNETSLEEIVKYCCEKKCRERDSWQFDPIPHTSAYCEKRCPIALFILNKE